MRGGDDGKVPAQGCLDVGIEMVGVVVREENERNGRKIMKVDGGIGPARARHARAQMDVVTRVEEIGLIENWEESGAA